MIYKLSYSVEYMTVYTASKGGLDDMTKGYLQESKQLIVWVI
jgi:hypothetical protein